MVNLSQPLSQILCLDVIDVCNEVGLTSEHSLCSCKAVHIVDNSRLATLVGGNPNGDGAVADGHDSRQQGDDTELVKVWKLQAANLTVIPCHYHSRCRPKTSRYYVDDADKSGNMYRG